MSTFITRLSGGPGLRVAVKDLIDMEGLPTTAGCRAVERRARPASSDAACLAGLRRAELAGEVRFVGRTNLNELAYGIDGINPWFGTPVNPLDPSLIPGGSSSGSAAAVGSGEADVGLGTDTGGSNRIPAACCGVAGLKTTWGRIPVDGVQPLAPSLDTVGVLARDVAGLARGMALLEAGFEPASAGEVPDVVGRFRPPADPAIDAAIDTALHAAGLSPVDVRLPGWEEASWATLVLIGVEAWEQHGALLCDDPAGFGAVTADRLFAGANRTADERARAAAVRAAWGPELGEVLSRVGVVALPTITGEVPTLDDAHLIHERRATYGANLAGVPAVALPIPRPGRPPASLQLVGAAGSEEQLLALAARIEAATA